MLSVIIPTRNDERALVPTLASLVPAAADGVVRDVIVADGGSTDATLEVADLAGCVAIGGYSNRGARLDAAARGARGPWLLFLEPGVTLEPGWHHEARGVTEAIERAGDAATRGAAFRYALDDFGSKARLAEGLSAAAALLTGLPRLEQGLLVHRSAYERAGGFRPLPAMAEADLIRRIGLGRMVRLRSRALAPARRPQEKRLGRGGPRAALGAGLLMLRVPPSFVARLYG